MNSEFFCTFSCATSEVVLVSPNTSSLISECYSECVVIWWEPHWVEFYQAGITCRWQNYLTFWTRTGSEILHTCEWWVSIKWTRSIDYWRQNSITADWNHKGSNTVWASQFWICIWECCHQIISHSTSGYDTIMDITFLGIWLLYLKVLCSYCRTSHSQNHCGVFWLPSLSAHSYRQSYHTSWKTIHSNGYLWPRSTWEAENNMRTLSRVDHDSQLLAGPSL